MGLFKKKEKSMTPEEIAKAMAEEKAGKDDDANKQKSEFDTGNPKVDMWLTRFKAQLDGLNENRKIVSDRFSRIGEQIGEVRSMVMDTNKTISTIEVSSTKAVDLVESVQPEKLMIEVRKMDGKIEGLRANIEANESLMKDLMGEMKKMRQQMNFYKGVEQVAKMNEEIKKEVAESKKVQAVIERHSDKVETIFLEVSKKFADFDKFNDTVKDMSGTFKVMQNDFDKIKVNLDLKATKKEFQNLVTKFNDFEKHTSNVVKLLDDKTQQSKKELDDKTKKMIDQLEKKADVKFDFSDKPKEKKSGGLFSKLKKKGKGGEEDKPEEDKKIIKKGEEPAEHKDGAEDSAEQDKAEGDEAEEGEDSKDSDKKESGDEGSGGEEGGEAKEGGDKSEPEANAAESKDKNEDKADKK